MSTNIKWRQARGGTCLDTDTPSSSWDTLCAAIDASQNDDRLCLDDEDLPALRVLVRVEPDCKMWEQLVNAIIRTKGIEVWRE